MDEHDDYRERLEAVRLRALVNETGVRVLELAVLFSAFESVARGAELAGGPGPIGWGYAELRLDVLGSCARPCNPSYLATLINSRRG